MKKEITWGEMRYETFFQSANPTALQHMLV